MTLQGVFFDMGGTIETYRHDRELRLEATPDLNKILLRPGIDLGLGIEQLWIVVTEGLGRHRRWCSASVTELSPAGAWGEYILGGCPVDVQRLAAVVEDLSYFLETRYYHREMRPGIPQVLGTIQEMGLKMGVISNTLSRGQVPGKLEEYGIKHFFGPIVMSSTYGRRKPDPGIFHHAASLAGVPMGACAHVGDRIVRDIMGARRAGYRLAMQIRHDLSDGERDDDPLPDAVLDDMMELVDMLEAALHRSSSTDIVGDKHGTVRAILFDAGDLLCYRPNKGERIDRFDYDRLRPTLGALEPQWEALIAGRQGFFLEDKGWALDLHARSADEGEAAQVLANARRLANAVIDRADPELFRLLGGHKFLEIGPRLAHKGLTVAHLLDQYPWPGA